MVDVRRLSTTTRHRGHDRRPLEWLLRVDRGPGHRGGGVSSHRRAAIAAVRRNPGPSARSSGAARRSEPDRVARRCSVPYVRRDQRFGMTMSSYARLPELIIGCPLVRVSLSRYKPDDVRPVRVRTQSRVRRRATDSRRYRAALCRGSRVSFAQPGVGRLDLVDRAGSRSTNSITPESDISISRGSRISTAKDRGAPRSAGPRPCCGRPKSEITTAMPRLRGGRLSVDQRAEVERPGWIVIPAIVAAALVSLRPGRAASAHVAAATTALRSGCRRAWSVRDRRRRRLDRVLQSAVPEIQFADDLPRARLQFAVSGGLADVAPWYARCENPSAARRRGRARRDSPSEPAPAAAPGSRPAARRVCA